MSFAEQFSSYYDHIHRPSHLPELQATDSKDFENIVWLVYNGPALEFYAKESYIPLLDGVIVEDLAVLHDAVVAHRGVSARKGRLGEGKSRRDAVGARRLEATCGTEAGRRTGP